MKEGMRTGDELVERYCARLDKNVTVHRKSGEKIGYTCSCSDTCNIEHCLMCSEVSDTVSDYTKAGAKPGYTKSAASVKI